MAFTTTSNMCSVEQEVVTTAPAAKLLEQFTLFPKLAIELRLRIREFALPVGPQGLRVLRVAADEVIEAIHSTTRASIPSAFVGSSSRAALTSVKTTSSHLTFHLLDHQHNDDIKDCSLLRTCVESRNVYLKHFTQDLRIGQQGLIRFAKEDIVYISNVDYILTNDDIYSRLIRQGGRVQGINCRKLALPAYYLDPHMYYYWLLALWAGNGRVLGLVSYCKILEELGAVTGDWDLMRGKGWSKKYLANHGAERFATLEISSQEECLEFRDKLRGRWETCSELRDQKMPELCVWDMDGKKLSRGGS